MIPHGVMGGGREGEGTSAEARKYELARSNVGGVGNVGDGLRKKGVSSWSKERSWVEGEI